jgi:hypothetical protein
MTHRQITGQSDNMEMAKGSFGKVAKLRYLGMTVTNQNLIHDSY